MEVVRLNKENELPPRASKHRGSSRRKSVGILQRGLNDRTNKTSKSRRKSVSFGKMHVRVFDKNENLSHTTDLGATWLDKVNEKSQPRQLRRASSDGATPQSQPIHVAARQSTPETTPNSSMSSGCGDEFFSPIQDNTIKGAASSGELSLAALIDSPEAQQMSNNQSRAQDVDCDDREDVSMEMTQAYGKVISQHNAADDDNDDMEMTGSFGRLVQGFTESKARDDTPETTPVREEQSYQMDFASDFASANRRSSSLAKLNRMSMGTAKLASFLKSTCDDDNEQDNQLSLVEESPARSVRSKPSMSLQLGVSPFSTNMSTNVFPNDNMEFTKTHGAIVADNTNDGDDNGEDMNMSMEMTQAHGGILAAASSHNDMDMSMEMTQAHGRILSMDVGQNAMHDAEEGPEEQNDSMEFTKAHGKIVYAAEVKMASELGSKRSPSQMESPCGEQSAKRSRILPPHLAQHFPANQEEMTMEMTQAYGRIISQMAPETKQDSTEGLTEGMQKQVAAILAAQTTDKTCELPSFQSMSEKTKDMAALFGKLMGAEEEVDLNSSMLNDSIDEAESEVEHEQEQEQEQEHEEQKAAVEPLPTEEEHADVSFDVSASEEEINRSIEQSIEESQQQQQEQEPVQAPQMTLEELVEKTGCKSVEEDVAGFVTKQPALPTTGQPSILDATRLGATRELESQLKTVVADVVENVACMEAEMKANPNMIGQRILQVFQSTSHSDIKWSQTDVDHLLTSLYEKAFQATMLEWHTWQVKVAKASVQTMTEELEKLDQDNSALKAALSNLQKATAEQEATLAVAQKASVVSALARQVQQTQQQAQAKSVDLVQLQRIRDDLTQQKEKLCQASAENTSQEQPNKAVEVEILHEKYDLATKCTNISIQSVGATTIALQLHDVARVVINTSAEASATVSLIEDVKLVSQPATFRNITSSTLFSHIFQTQGVRFALDNHIAIFTSSMTAIAREGDQSVQRRLRKQAVQSLVGSVDFVLSRVQLLAEELHSLEQEYGFNPTLAPQTQGLIVEIPITCKERDAQVIFTFDLSNSAPSYPFCPSLKCLVGQTSGDISQSDVDMVVQCTNGYDRITQICEELRDQLY